MKCWGKEEWQSPLLPLPVCHERHQIFQRLPDWGFRKEFQQFESLATEIAHGLVSVFQPTAGADKIHHFSHFIWFFAMPADEVDDVAAFGRAGVFQCINEGQGHFLFLDVDAQGFPYIISAEIEEVIPDLESDADQLAELAHPLNQHRIR